MRFGPGHSKAFHAEALQNGEVKIGLKNGPIQIGCK